MDLLSIVPRPQPSHDGILKTDHTTLIPKLHTKIRAIPPSEERLSNVPNNVNLSFVGGG
jgi:hypothetical protein